MMEAAKDLALSQSVSPAPRREERPQKAKQSSDGPQVSKLKMGLSDVGGSVFAQGFNEGWSYLMRVAGRASVDGFVATQNDYLQASVPALGGMLWYLIELYGVGTKPPSAFKLGRMETGKLLANLGMAKFFQALRSRSADAKKELEEAQEKARKAVAQNENLAASLEQLKKQLEEMARKERAGGAGNGPGGGGK